MKPVEYQCDDGIVSIRWCPEFISAIGNKPGYWYLKMPLRPYGPGCLEVWRQGWRTLYWNGESWVPLTPKQFATAEAALAEWENVIPPVQP